MKLQSKSGPVLRMDARANDMQNPASKSEIDKLNNIQFGRMSDIADDVRDYAAIVKESVAKLEKIHQTPVKARIPIAQYLTINAAMTVLIVTFSLNAKAVIDFISTMLK